MKPCRPISSRKSAYISSSNGHWAATPSKPWSRPRPDDSLPPALRIARAEGRKKRGKYTWPRSFRFLLSLILLRQGRRCVTAVVAPDDGRDEAEHNVADGRLVVPASA